MCKGRYVDFRLHLHDRSFTQSLSAKQDAILAKASAVGKKEERQAPVGENVCKKKKGDKINLKRNKVQCQNVRKSCTAS